MRTLSRHGFRMLTVTALALGAVGLAPSQAQAADPMTFHRNLSCTVAGKYTATALMTFELRPDESLAFHWKRIQYTTTPRFKADYVSFSYGKGVKVRFGKPGGKKLEVPHVVNHRPKNKSSALPAHLTMKVLSKQGSCIAKFL